MITLGVDPGLDGALAALLPDGELVLEMVPLVESKTGRDTYDIDGILTLLDRFPPAETFAILEKLQPMPMEQGGTIANYNRGRAMAVWEVAFTAKRIPYQLVAPRTWQKQMHAGTSGSDTKQRSIVAAQRLFPGVDLRRSERARIPHDGKAEALLLAAYARRIHAGQMNTPAKAIA